MGYYVTYDISGVRIPQAKVQSCLNAINRLHTDENLEANAGGGKSGPGVENEPVPARRWYSWVSNPAGMGFPTLVEAFQAWRFEAREDPNGDVYLEYFSGEKLGDEGNHLFPAIAPFVDPDGEATVEARGEDGAMWRHLFKDGTVEEQYAKISWE